MLKEHPATARIVKIKTGSIIPFVVNFYISGGKTKMDGRVFWIFGWKSTPKIVNFEQDINIQRHSFSNDSDDSILHYESNPKPAPYLKPDSERNRSEHVPLAPEEKAK